MEKTKKLKNNLGITSIFKGCLIAIAISLVGILFFAFVIKLFGLTDNWIKPINQIIKVISIMVATWFAFKKDTKNGLIKGIIIGLCYTILAFVIFSILNGTFCVDKSLLTDILFGTITGAICGVITVNFKSKSK